MNYSSVLGAIDNDMHLRQKILELYKDAYENFGLKN